MSVLMLTSAFRYVAFVANLSVAARCNVRFRETLTLIISCSLFHKVGLNRVTGVLAAEWKHVGIICTGELTRGQFHHERLAKILNCIHLQS